MADIVKVGGLKTVLANFKRSRTVLAARSELGLKAAGLFLQGESQRLAPVDTGNLKASAFTRSTGKGFSTSVTVGYTAAYALFVHEKVKMSLRGQDRPLKGKFWDPQNQAQAKFLEQPARTKSADESHLQENCNVMTASLAQVIYQLLIDLGHIEESDGSWPAFVSFFPNTPHNAVAIFDTAGIPDGRIMTGEKIEHPGIQIRVRSSVYLTAVAKIKEIVDALAEQRRVTVEVESDVSYLVSNIQRQGTTFSVGVDVQDGQRRHHFTVNYAASLETA